ncbi:MAG: [Treponema sp.]|nr:[FeFe] hydrogenase H-cluster maturation GTPase HydF [Treponema sp.]
RISRADLVLFVTANNQKIQQSEKELLAFLRQKKIPYIGVITFCPKESPLSDEKSGFFQKDRFIALDLKSPQEEVKLKIADLMNLIESLSDSITKELTPVQGIVKEGSTVILVTPIDKAAPKGRLILPQVETIRDLLDRKCSALVTTTENLPALYESLKKRPDLVITDSQAFKEVAEALPPDQSLTSFSILFARKKGDFSYFLKSLSALKDFPKNGKILIMEACSHHRQDDDIGSVKIPNLLKKKFGDGIIISHTKELDHSISGFNLVIHCGACMLSRKAMLDRMEIFKNEKVPVLNYGLFLAWANGLFPRATECLFQGEISEES